MPNKRIEQRDERMLTRQEADFVAFYIEQGGVKEAAKIAAEKAGLKNGAQLLKRPNIRKAIGHHMGAIMKKKAVTGERVVEELAKIAFANIDDFVDDDYRIMAKPSRKKMAAVQEVTTETYTEGKGDDAEEVKRVKLKMYSKLDALNSLGRHFGIFQDKVEISGDLTARLDRAFAKLQNEGAEPQTKDDEE